MKRSRIVIIVVLVLVLLALLLARCGSSSSSPSDSQGSTASTQPTEELSLIGVECDSPGEVVEEAGASFVCAPAKKGGEKAAIYYGVATPAEEQCETAGETRSADGIFSVCSNDKDAKKRKWLITVPMPVSITSFIDPGDSTEPAALEEVGVTIPEVIAALPGMQEFAVASTTTEPVTTVASTTSQPTTGETTVPDSTIAAASSTPSSDVTATTATPGTTIAPATTTAPVTTLAPNTTAAVATTAAPATTVAPTTTVAPATTAAPTTTEEPATTIAPATTAAPTTTEEPATTVAPSTTSAAQVAQTCAQGGACGDGDIGPAGGTVLVLRNDRGGIESVFEVAPVTWYSGWQKASDYATKLTFGSKRDWRLPTTAENRLMAASRNLFTCPGKKRCARGFSGGYYWSSDPTQPPQRAFLYGQQTFEANRVGGAYVRPVRSIGAPG